MLITLIIQIREFHFSGLLGIAGVGRRAVFSGRKDPLELYAGIRRGLARYLAARLPASRKCKLRLLTLLEV